MLFVTMPAITKIVYETEETVIIPINVETFTCAQSNSWATVFVIDNVITQTVIMILGTVMAMTNATGGVALTNLTMAFVRLNVMWLSVYMTEATVAQSLHVRLTHFVNRINCMMADVMTTAIWNIAFTILVTVKILIQILIERLHPLTLQIL